MTIPEPESTLLSEALRELPALAQAATGQNETEALRRSLNTLRMATLDALSRLNDAETAARLARTPEYH